ncbi:MAG: SMP-30/gluconolactonase/LRE family protein, partial [Bacteroidetes bacterium]|nr:SMP-30/gluconolactonase/LRE family protein [Bacteroidota bacterium]
MILLSIFFIISGFSLCFSQTKSQIIADGAELTKVSSDYKFTEGPAVDAQGNVYFTDQPNDRIMKWSEDGTITTFMEPAGRANGLYFDAEGNLFACADEHNQLWKITPEKLVTVVIENYEGQLLNGPNDLWIHPDGGLYFTDPFYKRPYWSRTEKEIQEQNVYYLSPHKKMMEIAATDLVQPNGIIGTPNGKKLYVADIGDRKTYSFKINKDGTLSDRKLFTEMGSDGMTIDSKGNVYLTGKGVTVFNKKGEQIEHIPIDEGWTANVTFGGKDRQTL